MNLSPQALQAWRIFLQPHDNRGHVRRELDGSGINAHVAACFASAVATVERMRVLLGDRVPARILEIGSSTGLNCIALQRAFPTAEVIGIEPEPEAVAAAEASAASMGCPQTRFACGFGESLSFADQSMDFILCHTVIEHVLDTGRVIAEMARTLAPGGMISLEAPNYLWPREPHLNAWCIPLLGKPLIKLCARLQGCSREEAHFVDHLQLVYPRMLERRFASAGLTWRCNVRDKILAIAAGHSDQLKGYHFAGPVLRFLRRVGAVNAIAALIVRSGLHPSVMYTLSKGESAV